jgi:hypothetical protein
MPKPTMANRKPDVMTQVLDRSFGVLLLVGSVLHAYGAVTHYPAGSAELVWALTATLAGVLIAVINLVRAGRSADRTLAWIALAASLCWVAVAVAFGAAIGTVADPRVLWHAISALALAAFCLRTALGYAGRPATTA